MARRRPADVRLDLKVRGLRREPIEGVSPAGMRVIDRLEVDRRRPGATKSALRNYQRAVRDPVHRLWDDRYGCGIPECCPDPADLRRWLETVLRHLSPHDRRVLGARVATLDAQW
jgi:hypothetical protein